MNGEVVFTVRTDASDVPLGEEDVETVVPAKDAEEIRLDAADICVTELVEEVDGAGVVILGGSCVCVGVSAGVIAGGGAKP